MVQDPINPRTYKEANSLLQRLMDILRYCVIGDSMGVIACPPSTYTLFFPSTTKKKSEDPPKEKAAKIPKVAQTQDATPLPTRSKGYLINSCADKKLPPHTKLTVNPCYQKLTTGDCTYSNCCHFHGVLPKDYYRADRIVMSGSLI